MNMNSCPHNISGQSGWVPNPAVSCLLNICPPTSPIPSNGFSSACAIGAASCTPGCNSGYTLSGMYTCTGLAGTKIWTNSNATCTANPCAILPAAVASGNVSGCLATNASKSCSPVCDANYIGNGSYFCNPATSIQNASSWSGSVVCQRNFCSGWWRRSTLWLRQVIDLAKPFLLRLWRPRGLPIGQVIGMESRFGVQGLQPAKPKRTGSPQLVQWPHDAKDATRGRVGRHALFLSWL